MTITFFLILCTFTFVRCSLVPQHTIDEILKSGDKENLLVELPNGLILGKDNDFYYSYESIPYAQAPLGELRLEAPKPFTQKWEAVFDARIAPPSCMQWDQLQDGLDKLGGQEDCLTVNVYNPKRKSNEGEGKLPVLVLIHGGAFMFGSVNAYGHDPLMRTGQIIVVKIAYRLGPLGFLSTEDAGIAGNFGLKDQRLALQWIQQNIGHFGGDPSHVIAVGFSAGAASVHLQMMHEDFSTLAKVAVSVSGTAQDPWVLMPNGSARLRAFDLGTKIGCVDVYNSIDLKQCLKQKPANYIVRAVQEFLIYGYNPFTTFGPVLEDRGVSDPFLTQSVETLVKSGKVAHVPWLTTYTAQDGGYNAAELLQLTPDGTELIEIFNERWLELAPHALFFKEPASQAALTYAKTLKQEYLGEQNFSLHTYRDVQRMYTDVLFKNGVEEALRLHKDIPGGAPVYAYRYENAANRGYAHLLSQKPNFKFGTVHGDDILLIFFNPVREAELRPDEEANSQNLIDMLLLFVKDRELKFGTHKFVNNVGQDDLQLLCITGTNAESKSFVQLP